MVKQIERPLDLLNELKGQIVLVKLKGQDELIRGRLEAFDIHINLIIFTDKLEFIKGDNVISVC